MRAAAAGGFVAVVYRLLERGAKPNAAGKYGWTALMLAAQGGHLPVVKRLLERGAEPGAARRRTGGCAHDRWNDLADLRPSPTVTRTR